MLSLLLMAQFITAIHDDPITQEKQAIFSATGEGGTLALSCSPRKHDINIDFIPDGYYGYTESRFLWKPSVEYRFGNQNKPQYEEWYFFDKTISYSGSDIMFGNIKQKANFIDLISRNSILNIRVNNRPDSTLTISFGYYVGIESMRDFLKLCDPKKVNARLREIGSPVAPSE